MGQPGAGWVCVAILSGCIATGCDNGSTAPVPPQDEAAAGPAAPIEAPEADEAAAALGFRPATDLKGTFEGTVWISSPAGDVVGVNVSARAGRSVDPALGWDLYFFDATKTLSATGQLALKSGASQWLQRDDGRAFVQAEVISLDRDVLQSPGWKVLQHATSGDVKGQAYMRVPSSGADLEPLRLSFYLRPRDLAACDLSCGAGSQCDPITGFCAEQLFAPGEFRGDLELHAVHDGLSQWSYGPEVPSSLGAANVWCASDALGFRGEWTVPTMSTMARPVMPRSGDLFCLDPADPALRARARGPVPLVNRADLEDVGIVTPLDADRLSKVCLNELERRPPLGFAGRFGESTAGFTGFRDGYLNYEADCVSMGHVSALVHLAQAGIFDNGPEQERAQVSRRTLSRLLQQWIALHSFIASNHAGLGGEQRVDQMQDGWAAVLQLLGNNALEYLIDPTQTDYRQGLRFGLCRGGCGDPALRCETNDEVCSNGACRPKQCVLDAKSPGDPGRGLPASLMDGLATHMRLVTSLLNAKPTLQSQQKYGEAVRYALLVESLAQKLVSLGSRCETPGIEGCPVPVWMPAFESARRSYVEARQDATVAAVRVGAIKPAPVPSLHADRPSKPL
ncbi:MAG: hypothetical protein SF187_01230 [Deltaproteobacteria bacterium]|nr:hypothetical protein [Deltaproteobacteria bacterium]